MTSITQLPIPVHRAIKDFAQSTASALQTAHSWNKLVNQFEHQYGNSPTHIIRAPGRVNIIGEHIDYALFGVLPAAIENELAIAIRVTPDSNGLVKVANTDAKYTSAEFTATRNGTGEWDLAIDPKALRWESYVKAGYLGVLEKFFPTGSNDAPLGMQAMFTSNIPAGSGVSSSAALIVASTLAFLVVNGKLASVTKGDLVGMSILNEKKVGVHSGGMDQSASILSSPGNVLYIPFYPDLQPSPIPLPSSSDAPSAFVIANSLTVSNKAETGKSRYNLRVVETLAGARVLSRVLGINYGLEERLTYRQVLHKWIEKQGKEDNEKYLKDAITTLLDSGSLDKLKGKSQDGVLLEEMIEMCGMNKEDFQKVFLSWVEVEATHFQLYRRAMHVFTEARRVLQFRDLCSSTDASGATALQELGKLMDESQKSCSQLFECSCPELNELTALAKTHGAYGSRLTGAGWGGCTVSLVKEKDVPAFLANLRENYGPFKNLDEAAFSAACFATKPAEGACVFEL